MTAQLRREAEIEGYIEGYEAAAGRWRGRPAY
jgi:hypothetical protein